MIRQPHRSTIPLPLLLLLLTLALHLPITRAQQPCTSTTPCLCTLQLLTTTLSTIPSTLLPPVAWTPITSIIPTITRLLNRPPPPPSREASSLREIESATDSMFASQFAAHAVAFNARVMYRRVKPLIAQLRSGRCDTAPRLGNAPTADVFATRFPPTKTVVSTLLSHEALRTVVKPYTRALMKTEALFSNFSRNRDVKTAVDSAVALFEEIATSGFNATTTAEKFAAIDALDLGDVFNKLVRGWHRDRKASERRVFLAIADQVEPLPNVQICGIGPVNSVTCGICT